MTSSVERRRMKKLLLVLFVLTAFAANSILCRIALKQGYADPETFSLLRLLGGAIAQDTAGAQRA
jgi:hypothetical protein